MPSSGASPPSSGRSISGRRSKTAAFATTTSGGPSIAPSRPCWNVCASPTSARGARPQALARREAPALRKQLDDIDPWRNSSLLVADYEALLTLLAQPPSAAPSGSAVELGPLRSELDQRLRAIDQKLKAAEECEEED